MCISQMVLHLVNQYFFTDLTVSVLEIQDGSDKFTAGLVADLATANLQIQRPRNISQTYERSSIKLVTRIH
jgi:hypothetical protein